ncbi:MAG: hypothetical protein Q4C18_01985 [Eubacteriales bacterium]|nr:hypothetical protein [Eubacteriales bacterium]
MKKKLAFIITLILALTMLPSCSNQEKEAVQKVADGFMSSLESGDFSETTQYSTDEVRNQISIRELENLSGVFYESIGLKKKDLSKKTRESVDNFSKKMKEDFITEYKIGDIEIKDKNKKATVQVNVTYGYNPDKLADINVDSELEKIADTYMTKHKDSLTDLYVSKGSKALQKKVYSDILPDVLKAYSKKVEATGTAKQELQLTLKKQDDDSWIIDGAYVSGDASSKDSEK